MEVMSKYDIIKKAAYQWETYPAMMGDERVQVYKCDGVELIAFEGSNQPEIDFETLYGYDDNINYAAEVEKRNELSAKGDRAAVMAIDKRHGGADALILKCDYQRRKTQ